MIPYFLINLKDLAKLNITKMILLSSSQIIYLEYLLKPNRFTAFLNNNEFIHLSQIILLCNKNFPLCFIIHKPNSGCSTYNSF